MTMHFAKLRLALAAFLTAGILGFGLPSQAWAQDEDEDSDNVLESDEVSGDDEEYEDDEDSGSTTIVIKDTDPSAVVIFRDKLSPYGSWMEHPTYGTVWVPSSALVGSEFAPYVSSGHWELTEDDEWLWVSDYEWGYIPFHYGRWVWVSGVGWGWIPGRVYAPAWVVWRTGSSGYIGWAPMPPGYYWADGVAVSLWLVPPAAYVFCHGHHVFHHHVHTHVIHDHTEVQRAAHGTTAYTPAKPTKKHKPAQPTLKEAGVEGKYAPKSYGKHDPKSTRFMRPDGKGDKTAALGKGSSPRSSGGIKGGGGSKGMSGPSGRARTEGSRGSRSLGSGEGVVTKRGSGRGSFTAGEPAPRSTGRKSKSSGKPSASGDASAPSASDAPTTKSSKPSKSSKSSKSSKPSSSGDDSSSSSRSSSPPSRSESPSLGSSRSSSPPMSRSSSSAPSTKRAAPKPAPKSAPRGPSRGGRGRR